MKARPTLPVASGTRGELEALRAAVQARYSEADLVAAALRDHIADLQHERDRLLTELARLRDDLRRERSAWLWRGSKANRGA